MSVTQARRHRAVILALAPVVGYDLTIPPQVFGEAVTDDGVPLYDVRVATLDGAPVLTTRGYGIIPTDDATALRSADTVIVPGTTMTQPRHEGTLPDDVAAALATVPSRARWVSICTGAFVLAAAGLLDGRTATTHWAYADDLRRLHPAVALDEDVLFSESDGVFTSAGLSAGLDLCLHLLRLDAGPSVANRVARHLVVPPWRDGGQAQFIERTVPSREDESTASARAWALERLDAAIDVAAMADHAAMSVRTFTRRFHAETGRSPAAWLTDQRVQFAQHLLEATDLGIDDIADRSGLGTAASLRTHLRRRVGVSPSSYRRSFRGVGAATGFASSAGGSQAAHRRGSISATSG